MTFDSKFIPDMWAVIPPEEKITSNSTESFHAHFNEQFYASLRISAKHFHIQRVVSSCYNSQNLNYP